jgi:NADH-quinone oxidoreductase subunit J
MGRFRRRERRLRRELDREGAGMELTAFVLASATALVSALVVARHRNPVISAMALVANLLATAVLFLTLGAEFVATLQVFVYAGAIMVLIVFVIMLLGLAREPDSMRASGRQAILASVAGTLLFSALMRGILSWGGAAAGAAGGLAGGRAAGPEGFGTAAWLARTLFSDYFYPFELISFVLLAAMAGAILLGKKEI